MKKEIVEELIKRVLPSYGVREMLGEGSFGVVYRISDNLKERAVKIILLRAGPSIEKGSVTSGGKKIERDFRHIVESYEKIACEEIVTVYDFFRLLASEDNKQATAYAVVAMELYPTNLFDYVVANFEQCKQLFSIEKAKKVMENLARMLGNLYTKRGFLFEDLKPENILVKEQDEIIKLVVGDIGGLKNLGSLSATSSQITLSYSAPEIIRQGQRPDVRSIIYSFGIISYFILEGHLPYDSHGVMERIDMIRDKGVTFERKDIPEHLSTVIGRCMAFEAESRYLDFNQIIEAIQDKPADERNKYSHETMELNSFIKRNPQNIAAAGEGRDIYTKTALPIRAAGGLSGGSMTLNTMRDMRILGEQTRLSEARMNIDKVTKEIRNLVIRNGDIYKIQNDSYKIFGDIRVEGGAMLVIENSKLYFEENSGIITSGTMRAEKSFFSAMDSTKRWKNIALCPSDTRSNFIRGCKFSFGKGRTWESMKNVFQIKDHALKDNYLYGGALFIAGVKDKIIAISDCEFHSCYAQEGGGIFCLKAQPSIENSFFDSCTTGLFGGGICCVSSAPFIRNCTLKNCSSNKEGGGLSCISSSPTIEGCTFDGCSTTYLYGGGIYCSGSNPVIKACKFNRCTSSKDGGGIYVDAKSSPRVLYPAFTNCRPNNTNEADKAKSHFFFR